MQDFTLDKGKLAIIVAGLFCLFAVYSAISEFKLPSDAKAVEPAQAIVELDPVNIQLLTQTHLFGQPPQAVATTNNNDSLDQRRRDEENKRKQQEQQQQQKQANARPIDINVTVTGLLASNDADFSAAVLKVDNKPEKLYRVGEDLGKPEVRLQGVDRDSVTIDNNGNEQIIALKRPGLESNAGANTGVRNNNISNSSFNQNGIPELPPELAMPEELESLNNAAFDGAYSPPLPEPVEFETAELETAEFGALPEEIQDQLLQDQLDAELEEEASAALESEFDDHGSLEEQQLDDDSDIDQSSPDFQMPVF